MTDNERDKLITEMHTDIKWIKEWTVEHKSIHTRIFLMICAALIGAATSLFK